MPSKIEWTDETWNPVFGCTKASRGCTNCYALAMAHRLERMGLAQYYGITKMRGDDLQWTGDVRVDESLLHKPLGWKKPKRIFVCSMADLFHRCVSDEFICKVFDVVRAAPRHTFLMLTKRAERMARFFDKHVPDTPSNLWVGVTVEDQEQADKRIPYLTMINASVRFVSCEPLLGEVLIEKWLDQLQWVIVGGESGPAARPMHPDWVNSLLWQCTDVQFMTSGKPIHFFFKQWGEWFPREEWEWNPELILPDDCDAYTNSKDTHVFVDGKRYYPVHRVGKKKAGRMIGGRTWDEFPQEAA